VRSLDLSLEKNNKFKTMMKVVVSNI